MNVHILKHISHISKNFTFTFFFFFFFFFFFKSMAEAAKTFIIMAGNLVHDSITSNRENREIRPFSRKNLFEPRSQKIQSRPTKSARKKCRLSKDALTQSPTLDCITISFLPSFRPRRALSAFPRSFFFFYAHLALPWTSFQ